MSFAGSDEGSVGTGGGWERWGGWERLNGGRKVEVRVGEVGWGVENVQQVVTTLPPIPTTQLCASDRDTEAQMTILTLFVNLHQHLLNGFHTWSVTSILACICVEALLSVCLLSSLLYRSHQMIPFALFSVSSFSSSSLFYYSPILYLNRLHS